MRILVINPSWNSYSEGWLHRSLSIIEQDVVGLATFNPGSDRWMGKAPTFNLYGSIPSFVQRLFWKIAPEKRKSSSLQIERDFARFVKQVKADRILINFIGPALYLLDALIKLQLPVFVHVHGVDVFEDATDELTGERIHSVDYSQRVSELLKLLPQIHFIANSQFTLSKLEGIGVDVKNITVKPFGAPINSPKVLRKGHLRILFLGRFVDFKGPDLVLDAFLRAHQMGLNATLTMVGGGSLKAACRLRALNSPYADNITFLEPVTNREALHLMREHDVYTMHNCHGTLSNQAEAFGVTVIEAMGQGTPVITGAWGGPTEIITSGKDGILVSPGDVKAHAQAFMDLDRDREYLLRLSLNAQETVSTFFSMGNESHVFREVLHQFR